MLSKSQARTFFITMTAGFSGVFLWLTVDTVRQTPKRSNAQNLSAEVVHGKELWERNNCMGCHTLLGEGAYYAPELTKVYERRGETWMKVFLKDPQAMFPGQRKMVQYDFTEEELDALVAFFAWIGEIDTNGFPAEPDLVQASILPLPAGGAGPDPLASAPASFTGVCAACHAVGGKGGAVGPALDDVATRYTAESMDAWLKDPQAIKPNTAMPNLRLSDEVRAELTSWLMTLE
jgi:nitric oxide reductase subunit C